jgi:hypothetical protein
MNRGMNKFRDRQLLKKINIQWIDKVSDNPLSVYYISCYGSVFPIIGACNLFGMGGIKTKPDDPGQKKEKKDEESKGYP